MKTKELFKFLGMAILYVALELMPVPLMIVGFLICVAAGSYLFFGAMLAGVCVLAIGVAIGIIGILLLRRKSYEEKMAEEEIRKLKEEQENGRRQTRP